MTFIVHHNPNNLRQTSHAELVQVAQLRALNAEQAATGKRAPAAVRISPRRLTRRSSIARRYSVSVPTATTDSNESPTEPSTRTPTPSPKSLIDANRWNAAVSVQPPTSLKTRLLGPRQLPESRRSSGISRERAISLYASGSNLSIADLDASAPPGSSERRVSLDAFSSSRQPESTAVTAAIKDAAKTASLSPRDARVQNPHQGSFITSPTRSESSQPGSPPLVSARSAAAPSESLPSTPSIDNLPLESSSNTYATRSRTASILHSNAPTPRSQGLATQRTPKTLVISPTNTATRRLTQFFSNGGSGAGGMRQRLRQGSESTTVQEVMRQMEVLNRDFTLQVSEYQDHIIELEGQNKELMAEGEELKRQLRQAEYRRVSETRSLETQLRLLEDKYRGDFANIKQVYKDKTEDLIRSLADVTRIADCYAQTLRRHNIPLPPAADTDDAPQDDSRALDSASQCSDRDFIEAEYRRALTRTLSQDARANALFTSIDASMDALQTNLSAPIRPDPLDVYINALSEHSRDISAQSIAIRSVRLAPTRRPLHGSSIQSTLQVVYRGRFTSKSPDIKPTEPPPRIPTPVQTDTDEFDFGSTFDRSVSEEVLPTLEITPTSTMSSCISDTGDASGLTLNSATFVAPGPSEQPDLSASAIMDATSHLMERLAQMGQRSMTSMPRSTANSRTTSGSPDSTPSTALGASLVDDQGVSKLNLTQSVPSEGQNEESQCTDGMSDEGVGGIALPALPASLSLPNNSTPVAYIPAASSNPGACTTMPLHAATPLPWTRPLYTSPRVHRASSSMLSPQERGVPVVNTQLRRQSHVSTSKPSSPLSAPPSRPRGETFSNSSSGPLYAWHHSSQSTGVGSSGSDDLSPTLVGRRGPHYPRSPGLPRPHSVIAQVDAGTNTLSHDLPSPGPAPRSFTPAPDASQTSAWSLYQPYVASPAKEPRTPAVAGPRPASVSPTVR
ncbi:hypothetical protein H4R35_000077 [Dimargaris xerosporica]|nr:hypothetical protein H4R35_000077 [Dimargaris xerosporica]